MEPLSEDQERMLLCWVSTNGNRRPGKGVKAFLAQANGLSIEQIDWWCENFRSPKKNTESIQAVQTSQLVNGLSTDPDMMALDDPIQDGTMNQSFLGNLELGLDIDFGANAFLPEAQTWSPMGVIHEETDSAFPGTFEDGSQTNFWSPTVGTQRGFLRSSASSLAESCPLLSPSGRHLSTDRSSYGSSLRTWDTSSTPASVYDPFFEEPVIESSEETLQTINPIDLSKSKPLPTSRFSINQANQEEGFALRGDTKTTPKDDHDQSKGPPVPPKPGKGQGSYICTTCQTPIAKKWDWARHENQHDPQGHWKCMMGNNPSIQTTTGWFCVFCNDFKTSREEMTLHLVKKHRIQECMNKTSRFSSSRKDKLKQHLQQVHNLADDANGWEAWFAKAAPEKYAWGCGFCGACLLTWEGRIQHIAQHYERQNVNIWQWSSSLVVQGLLMQAYPDFNVAEAWKTLVGNNRDGDRLLKWSKRDADTLKRKLEFHQDTPAKIATEANMLAMKVPETVDDLAWVVGDSRNTLACPIDRGGWRNTSSTTMSNGSSFQEPATQSSFGALDNISHPI